MGDMMANPREQPFFHRYQTKLVLAEICTQKRLVIFAGAGVTIDKSELSWKEMVDSLLKQHIADAGARSGFLASVEAISAASVAHELYFDAANKSNQRVDAREKIDAQLRTTLYRPGLWAEGRLTKAIADFVSVWSVSRSVSAHKGRRINVVTTNYDDYLLQEVKKSLRTMRKAAKKNESIPSLRLLFPTMTDPLRSPDKVHLQKWVAEEKYPTAKHIDFVYLHGRIQPSPTGAPSLSRLPVVSEEEYQLTRQYSVEALVKMFERSSVLLVGTSLTDPPQLEALYRTKKAAVDRGLKRWALFALPSNGELAKGLSTVEYVRLTKKRLQAFGVEPIFVDYRVQTVQFFRELAVCASEKKPSHYLDRYSDIRYGRRLLKWWNGWNKAAMRKSFTFDQHQMICHLLLSDALVRLKDLLGAPASEVMKIEIWLRWEPARHRKLRLWCSSVATWNETAAMRDASIAEDDDVLSIKAFRSGRPQAGTVLGSRWRHYVAMPLWVQDRHSEMIVGVVTMASMADTAENSLVPTNNSASIEQSFGLLTRLGQLVAGNNFDAVYDEVFGK